MKRTPHSISFLLFLCLIFSLSSVNVFASGAGHDHDHEAFHGHLKFLQNLSQWEPEVRFRADLPGGQAFLLDQSFVFCYQHPEDIQTMDALFHAADPEQQRKANSMQVRQHAYQMTFEQAGIPAFEGLDKTDGYYNFFVGNDRSKWAKWVPAFEGVKYQGLYPGIDLQVYSEGGNFKYEFHLQPGADPASIAMRYDHLENIKIKKGNLVLQTSVNEIIEQRPYAYQIVGGKPVEVRCEYVLQDNRVAFHFPRGYDRKVELIIDPVVIASTHSGSTATIYGHTATYDQAGNVFSAGAGFSPGGLPITMGAFQSVYGGGREYCVNKYNPTGSSLIFATYIGGMMDDLPHSMVTNINGDLYVLGSTSSLNYPTSTGAYQTASGGGVDIGITKLDPTGTILLGSTYVGGSASDGQNSIYVNYGDSYRGEIVVDPLDNVYIASMTSSTNFPTTGGAWQGTNGGMQNGVLFKLNSSLTALGFSTYMGGTGQDAAYGVIPDNQGGAYVTGSVSSQVFPNNLGSAYPNYRGGLSDAFLAHFNSAASVLQDVTYFGTGGRDQGFFIEEDRDGYIYVYGQTDSALGATPGVYSGPSTGMFIAKFSDTLGVHLFTSNFGNVAPTAFLVDNCGYIYCAGHGGLGSPSGSFDVSPNAIQATPAGFYILVLEPNATALNFGTYYGGSGSHVDGGTSRFDKRGFVYEATCTSSGFPTLPTAYATTNLSSWDVTVFKIDFQVNTIIAQAAASPATSGCAPLTVNFINTSVGQSFEWDFRDGSAVDTAFQPSHTFMNPGLYRVRLVAYDSTACVPYDTAFLQIQVLPPQVAATFTDSVDCATQTVFTTNTGTPGVVNQWSMGDGAIYNNLQNVSHTYAASGTYTITFIVTDTACNSADTTTSTVFVSNNVTAVAAVTPNDSGCAPFTASFTNSGNGNSYLWDFDDGSGTVTTAAPTHTFVNPGTYNVRHYAIDSSTCNIVDSVTIVITVSPVPVAMVPPDYIVCNGSTTQLSASGGDFYEWQPAAGMVPSNTVPNPTVTINGPTTFTVIVSNTGGCADTTSLTVDVDFVSIDAGPDASFCAGSGGAQLTAGAPVGGIAPFTYSWSCPGSPAVCAIDSVNDDDPFVNPPATTMYTLTLTDSAGCTAIDSALVTVYQVPAAGGYRDTILCGNSTLLLEPAAPPSASFLWQDNSSAPTFTVSSPGLYWVEIFNVCDTVRDSIDVLYEPWPTVELGNDTTICPQDSMVIIPVVNGVNSYLWNDGSTDPVLTITEEGWYTLEVGSPNCGTAFDRIRIFEDFLPVANIGPDLMFCAGRSVTLQARNYPRASYLWNTGSTVPTIDVTETNDYWVTITLPCGSATDSANIFFQPLPDPQLPADTTICPGDTLYFSPGIFSEYRWQDGFAGNVYPITQQGRYVVNVTDSVGCKGKDEVIIEECFPELYVPNAFTPNGDGLNELWFPVENGVDVFEVLVFNRWGKVIFTSDSAEKGWDGTHEGQPVQESVFTYLIYFKFPGGKIDSRAGTISLIR